MNEDEKLPVSTSMNIEVENEDEILRLQQEIIKSNIPIEDIPKIIGKLQKLLELTKHNTNDYIYRTLKGSSSWYDYLSTQPMVATNDSISGPTYTPYNVGSTAPVVTSNITTTTATHLRNDVPF